MKYEVKIVRLNLITDKHEEITETVDNCTNYIIDNDFVTFYLGVNLPGDANFNEINVASFQKHDIVSIKIIMTNEKL